MWKFRSENLHSQIIMLPCIHGWHSTFSVYIWESHFWHSDIDIPSNTLILSSFSSKIIFTNTTLTICFFFL
jgi:hypothetical protein